MPSLRKVANSPYWIACFRDKKGKQFNRSTKEKRKKEAWAVALEFERLAGGWIEENRTMNALFELASDLRKRLGDPLKVVSVRECFEKYLSSLESKAASTRVRYNQIVTGFLSFLGDGAKKNLIALTETDVQQYRDSRLKSGVGPVSADCELKVIRAALRRAVLLGEIKTNPAAFVPLLNEKSSVRSVFEVEQVTALLTACDGFNFRSRNSGQDWKGAMLVAFYTGARLSDIANLRWHQLDYGEKVLHITQKKKKFAQEIKVPLHPDLEAHFLSLSAPDDPKAFIFPKLAGRQTGGGGGLSREFVGLMDAAGIERRAIRPGGAGKGKIGRNVYNLGEHSFRHSFNTHLMRAGVPEDLRQRLCGHESKEVSKRYTHVEVENLRSSVAKLPSVSAFPANPSGSPARKSKKAK